MAIKLAFKPKTPKGKKTKKAEQDLLHKAVPKRVLPKAIKVGPPRRVLVGIGGWPVENMR